MSEVVLTTIIGPLTLLIAGFILTQVIQPVVNRNKKNGAAPVTVGEPVTAAAGWQVAHEGVLRELADERADHAACHDVMREHGIPVPPSHETA